MTDKRFPPPPIVFGRAPTTATTPVVPPKPVPSKPVMSALVQPKPQPKLPTTLGPATLAPLPPPMPMSPSVAQPMYSIKGAGKTTRGKDYANAFHSGKIDKKLIFPDGKKRERRGVARLGRGDGTAYGVGAFCPNGVPTTNATRNFTHTEKQAVNQLGRTYGCQTCGSKISGWPDGHFTPDHQPPLSLVTNLHTYSGELYPHCRSCSSHQGGILSKTKKIQKH